MLEILNQLNKTQGLTGSMIIGRDGIIIASDMADDFNEERLGAVASNTYAAIVGSIKRLDQGEFEQFTLSGDTGKMVMTAAHNSLLICLVEREVNISLIQVEIRNAVSAINEKASL